MTRFNKSIVTLPYAGNLNRSVEIKLATTNPIQHMNLIIEQKSATLRDVNITMMPGDAIKLRDALLEAYPLQTKGNQTAPAPTSKFAVGDSVVYTNIVGYGARGMEGRKGKVVEVNLGGWFTVIFKGPFFDDKQRVHQDYLKLDTSVPATFKKGDRVRKKSGYPFSDGSLVATIDRNHPALSSKRWWLVETATHVPEEDLELAYISPVDAVKAAVPAVNSGRYVVMALEGNNYLPSSKPYVHLTDIAANTEAQRLAKEVGGTFHVFRATFEASREKPVVPPVKTAKL